MRLLRLVVRRLVTKEDRTLNMQLRDKRNEHVLSNANWAVSVDRCPPVQASWFEICHPTNEECEAESNPLHLNWVLIDDTKGNHRAQMLWVVDR
jgi:hypothetical protein